MRQEWHDVQCNVTKYYVQNCLIVHYECNQYLIFKGLVFAYRHRNRVKCTRLNYEEPFIYSIKPQSKERYLSCALSDLYVATKRFCIRLTHSLFLQCTDSQRVWLVSRTETISLSESKARSSRSPAISYQLN